MTITFPPLVNEHSVAETEETVFFLDGDFIGFQDFFPRRQGADEHEQRRFGKMEISDQGIDDVEGEARIDEDIRPARTGLQVPVVPALSSVRMLVVPTAMTRRPSALALLILAAASGVML